MTRQDPLLSHTLQRVDAGHGPVWHTERSWPLHQQRGRVALSEVVALDDLALSRLAPELAEGDLSRLAFIDTETTGLSGGTGTYAFLVGVGTIEDERFVLRQFFLADVAAEAAMPTAVSETLSEGVGIVSFNGPGFDIPLLETRYILNRLRVSAFDTPRLDLLQPARRLYRRRLPSCRLVALEQHRTCRICEECAVYPPCWPK